MKKHDNILQTPKNNNLEFKKTSQINQNIGNRASRSQGIDVMVKERKKIMSQTQMLLDVDFNDIYALITHNLDDGKSKLLQNAFDMLEDYYQEDNLAQEIGLPSVRMLKYLPSIELLESDEMKEVYKFYISQKKKIETSNSQIVFNYLQINNIEKIITIVRPESAAIAADGKIADVDFQWSPNNKIHSESEDKKFLIDVEIINNRLEFLLAINNENEEEVNEDENGELKSGILHWGALDIEIKNGLGEIDWDNINKEEKEKLRTMPLIYTPHH